MGMKCCVMVDGYKWSKYFVEIIKSLEYDCIYIQSTLKPLPILIKSSTYNASDFIETIIYDGDLKKLVEKLKKFSPIEAVIPGIEPGVVLADQLRVALNLTVSNGSSKSLARTNKFYMAEALKAAGIKTAKYYKTNNYKELLNWTNSTKYPVVLKPLASAGTDGVSICNSEIELKKAFDEILAVKLNASGNQNTEVLAQEFLVGTEYIVNTVSCEGQHYLSDLWECKKRIVNGKPIYDRELLMPSEGTLQKQITDYVFKALNGLEIRYGAAHTEIMLTTEGPIFIETGARVGGNVIPGIHSECLGHNQAQLSVYSYLSNKIFTENTKKPYQIKKELLHVLMSTNNTGEIHEIPLIVEANKLRSFKQLVLSVKKGDKLVPTYDLFSKPGDVWLAHSNLAIVEGDYKLLIDIISRGFVVSKSKKEIAEVNQIARYGSRMLVFSIGSIIAYNLFISKRNAQSPQANPHKP